MLRFIRSRYDRNSVIAWAVLAVLYLGVFVVWNELIDWSLGMDWLLGGIWAFMTLTLAWDIQPRRDLTLVFVAFFGGLVIEWWGTTTNLWHYYTRERPPLWILPAWPVAALAIDRIARVIDASPVAKFHAPTWVALPVFVIAMVEFSWRSVHVPSTVVIIGLMAAVLLTTQDTRKDAMLFVGGSLLGYFLEYWGTSRHCWTYWSKEIPPVVAVFAHGFASVAFSRGVRVFERVEAAVRPRMAA